MNLTFMTDPRHLREQVPYKRWTTLSNFSCVFTETCVNWFCAILNLYSLIYLISSYWCFKMTKKKSLKYDTKKESDAATLTLSSLASHLSSLNSYSHQRSGAHAVEALACRARASGRTFGVFAHEPRLQASPSLPPKIPRWFISDELFFITRIFISLQNSWLARCGVRWTQTGEKMFGYSWWPGRRFCWHVWLSRPSRESGNFSE